MSTTYEDYGINRNRLFASSRKSSYHKTDRQYNRNAKNGEDGELTVLKVDTLKNTNRRVVKVKKSNSKNSLDTSANGNRGGSKSFSKTQKVIKEKKAGSKSRSKTGSKTGSKTRSRGRQSTFSLNDPNVDAVLNSQLMTKKISQRKYAKKDGVDQIDTDQTPTESDAQTDAEHSGDQTLSIDTGDSDDTKSSDGSKKKREKDPIPIKEAIKDARDRARYVDVRRFFRDPNRCSKESIQLMVDIINSNHEISLRNLNWFGTKHLDTMDSRYYTDENGEKKMFDPRISYGKRQGPYGKKGFDPFRRGLAFNWNYDPDDKTKTVITTLCQLQFFKWLFEYEMMDYILENLDNLKELQRKYEKKKKDEKKAKKEKKIKDSDKQSDASVQSTKKETDRNLKLKAKRTDTSAESKLIIRIG